MIRLTIYTNIPTPYQEDFFEALSAHFALKVVYYARTEKDRQWEITPETKPYQVEYVTDHVVARWLQRRLKDFHFSASLFRLVQHDPSDYIILGGSYWIPNTMLASFLLKWRRKPVAFFGERLAPSTSKLKRLIKRFSLLPLQWNCCRLLAIGLDAAESYRSYQINLPTSIIPYTINQNRFKKEQLCAEKLDRLRRQYKSDKQTLLLSSGSLTPRKNMETVINAVKNSDDKTRLLILGDGPDRAELNELVGSDDRFKLLGFVQADDLPYYYNLADIFVFASHYDGWGVVINEAIAAGLPVVSSKAVGATREWIRDGVNGFVCNSTDVNGFRSAIHQLTSNPELYEKQAAYNRNLGLKTNAGYYAEKLYELVKNDLTV